MVRVYRLRRPGGRREDFVRSPQDSCQPILFAEEDRNGRNDRLADDALNRMPIVKPISNLHYLYLSTLSQPSCDRLIYRTIKKSKAASILEIGLGNGQRAENIIRLAQRFRGCGCVRYTGIDPFESAEQVSITLRGCHQQLNRYGAKLQLVPGDLTAIHRIANSHLRTDLIIVSAGYSPELLDEMWYYIPRMLHANSLVMMQPPEQSEGKFSTLCRLEIERKVKQTPMASRKAA